MGTPAKSRWRPVADFLLGTALAAAGAVLVWHFYPGFWKEPPAAAVDEAMERREALRSEALAQQAIAPRLAPPDTMAAGGKCDFEALIPVGSAADGHARAEHPFPGGPRAKAKVFLRAANEAAARQRPRDAEVALIAACRQNELASAKPTVPLARVLGLLGERYLLAATGDHPLEVRESLLARARHVLASSADVYAVALGPNASRSRQARQRVLDLEQDTLVAADVAPPAKPARAEAVIEARRAPARKAVAPRPSAELPEAAEPARIPRRVDSDPELRQLASDLARLRAQAEAVSDDPAGFRQRAEQAQAQRDQCRDAACLQGWYARRKRELLAEF
jgi:hypothetical protein